MKKIISILLTCVMIVTSALVFGDGTTSEAMERVLIAVKTKVDVPERFSEFSPYSFEQDGKLTYEFKWSTEDGREYISVSCDEKGRICRYYSNDNSVRSENTLTTLSKEDILSFADGFLKKAVPEAYASENDCLVFDVWSVNGNSYRINYNRICRDRQVKNDNALVRIYVCDDVPYVKGLDVSYNYDGEFSSETPLEDWDGKYQEAFPLELIYRDVYNDEDKNKTVLLYRIKDNDAGFLSAIDYSVVTEDESNELYYGTAGGGEMKNEAATDTVLRDEEIKELANIEGLISKKDADEILKALPYVALDGNMEMSSYSINQRDKEYVINIRYNAKEKAGNKYLSAALNAKTGKVLSLYSNSDYENLELTDVQKKTAEKRIEEFVKKAAVDEFLQCKEQKENSFGYEYSKNYDRYVNDIRYIDDGIDVTYNVKTGKITSYRLDFDDKNNFDKAESIVNAEDAYNALLETAPVRKIWVMSGGIYIPCWTLGRQAVEIDAFTGEEYSKSVNTTQEYAYSDIEGHWAKEKIQKLAEFQIGFEGEKFYPDAPIAQYDILRIFAAGIHYKDYLTYPKDMLYENFIYDGILTEEEKNPDGQVLREDAFVYMVRIDGLDKVAKLSDIFNVEYADQNMLSEGKIGYPAILTGMNIICGNGGYLKPKAPITRAEAAVMVYNYLINK